MDKTFTYACATRNDQMRVNNQIIREMAKQLGGDYARVEENFHRYGEDYLYTPKRPPIPYDLKTRRQLQHLARVVIYLERDSDGTYIMHVYGRAVRERNEYEYKSREFEDYKRDLDKFHVERKRERFFSDGQTKPSPKKQGKGNSIGDIGKYKDIPPVSINDGTRTFKQPKFRAFKVGNVVIGAR